MKQALLPVALLFTVAVHAQTLKLNKGQKISVVTTVTQNIDMGMGDMKNNSSSTSIIEIKDADTKNYNAVYTLTKLALSISGMGQDQSYDSEKAEDKDSELGKSINEKIGKETKITIDKNTGKAASLTPAPEKKEEDGDDPFGGLKELFGSADSESAIAESAIFIIPAGKKAGDSWSDSLNVKDAMKGTRTYTLKSINGSEAVVGLFSKMEGKQNMEMQGMQIDINLSAKTEGELTVDPKTFLVKKSSRVADITGNMDLMGQSMPITSKMTEITEYK